MGKSKISVIIAREFSVRVKKKSFILTTVLVPLFFAACMIVPGLIATMSSGEEGLKVAVVDDSGIVVPYMESNKEVIFEHVTDKSIDELKNEFESLGVYAVAHVSQLDSNNNLSVSLFADKQVNIDVMSKIERFAEKAVEQKKLEMYNIPNLKDIIDDLYSGVKVNSYKLSQGEESVSKVEIYMIIGYIASFMIYMFVLLFGNMVMRSVIEEKTTRIIEVLVSSVKPFQILMGKIIGVASVALVQFLIWIVITVAAVSVVSSMMGPQVMAEAGAQQMQMSGLDVSQVSQVSADNEFGGYLEALKGVNYFGIAGAFIVYFILGYLLYSSMFAAIGAAVDNEADTQQLSMPVTMPLIIGLFIMLHTFQYPDSAISFWGSIIPFTSPMVMMARIAYGVPAWELALSIGLLFATFVGMTYLSAKIYRVGILMYGKKPGWKDLFKWLKY